MTKEGPLATIDFNPADLKIALLAGGISEERDVSLSSAKGARAALEAAGFQVCQLDPALKDDLKHLVEEPFDAAFLCVHGPGGEDGRLQGFLETIGLPYTGSDVAASAIAMDKARAKEVYRRAGILTAPSITIHEGETVDIPAIVAELGEHCVVKAANEGSTFGIFIVEKADDLARAIEKAFQFDKTVVIERYIQGDEYTVSVMESFQEEGIPFPLPIIQIIPQFGFYDFEAKYAPGGSDHLCPAPIPDELARTMQDAAVLAHKALGCSGMSRTDFIVDGDGIAWALETNTIPGMTETSLFPEAARVAGKEFPEVCTILVREALKKAAR